MAEFVATGYGYEGKPGQRHRIFAHYGGRLLPVMWFSVGRDGSLYLGPYVPNANGIKSGTVQSDQNGRVDIKYEDGLDFRPADGSATKVSFHSSGAVHYDEKRAFTPQLAQRRFNDPICYILPAKPRETQLKPASEVRKRDIVTEHQILDDRPSHIAVFYSIGLRHEIRENAAVEWKTIVQYPNLERVGSAILEIALIQNAGGTWPPDAYFLARADPDKRTEGQP